MNYNTWIFAAFVLITVLIYYIVPKNFRWIVLLTFSCGYYLINSSVLILCLLITTVSIYLCALKIGKINDELKQQKKADNITKEEKKLLKEKTAKRKKLVVVLSIVINFGILAFLKYFNFFSEIAGGVINWFLPDFQSITLRLALPLGISFYTLQAISYVIDVYRGKIKPDKHFGRVALFLIYFPQITEGPIGRYGDLVPQLYKGHKFDYKRFTYGLQLILWGLFKKMVIADRAGIFADKVFDHYSNNSGFTVVLAILMYTLQLYCDFSGCIDIVSGVSELFGVSLAKNFRRPFFSCSVQEFWRRWHITLGAWLRDYIFYPISFSKFFMKLSKKVRLKFNDYWAKILPMAFSMIFVWIGNGMWHGSGSKYICYGLYYYIIIMLGVMFEPVIQKTLTLLHINAKSMGYKLFQIIRTFVLVCIGMTIFRAKDLIDSFKMLSSIFTANFFNSVSDGTLWSHYGIYIGDFLILAAGVIVLLIASIIQENGYSIRDCIAKRNIFIRWAFYYTALFSVLFFGAYGIGYRLGDMIYAQF